MKQKSTDNLNGSKTKVAIVLARFNDHIGKLLYENTVQELKKLKVKNIELFRAPGALEIPFVANSIADRFNVIIALGIVIKGRTAHFEIVANESARGIMDVSIKTKTPIINGILTCYTEKQAKLRATSKGKEFAESAIEMSTLNL